ncbi:hypothetical protein BGZ65_004615 [Modicella reniformis]|uniref:Transcription activator GCR1-like domain-containing protein n=1 Tax=Modicella reniformis TaxID=1440133 RepID=A0A9P6J6B7_9FUNG|nr:hypothetical protein BGZ65_004615 [Modicella reniformis]
MLSAPIYQQQLQKEAERRSKADQEEVLAQQIIERRGIEVWKTWCKYAQLQGGDHVTPEKMLQYIDHEVLPKEVRQWKHLMHHHDNTSTELVVPVSGVEAFLRPVLRLWQIQHQHSKSPRCSSPTSNPVPDCEKTRQARAPDLQQRDVLSSLLLQELLNTIEALDWATGFDLPLTSCTRPAQVGSDFFNSSPDSDSCPRPFKPLDMSIITVLQQAQQDAQQNGVLQGILTNPLLVKVIEMMMRFIRASTLRNMSPSDDSSSSSSSPSHQAPGPNVGSSQQQVVRSISSSRFLTPGLVSSTVGSIPPSPSIKPVPLALDSSSSSLSEPSETSDTTSDCSTSAPREISPNIFEPIASRLRERSTRFEKMPYTLRPSKRRDRDHERKRRRNDDDDDEDDDEDDDKEYHSRTRRGSKSDDKAYHSHTGRDSNYDDGKEYHSRTRRDFKCDGGKENHSRTRRDSKCDDHKEYHSRTRQNSIFPFPVNQLKEIPHIWQEWHKGWNGGPSIQSMIDQYGKLYFDPRFREHQTFFYSKELLVRAINKAVGEGISEEEAITRMEHFREGRAPSTIVMKGLNPDWKKPLLTPKVPYSFSITRVAIPRIASPSKSDPATATKDHAVKASPTTTSDHAARTKPTTTSDQAARTKPTTTTSDHAARTKPTTTSDHAARTKPTTTSDYAARTKPTTTSDYAARTKPTTTSDYAARTKPTTTSDYAARTKPTITIDYAARTKPTTTTTTTRCSSATPTFRLDAFASRRKRKATSTSSPRDRLSAMMRSKVSSQRSTFGLPVYRQAITTESDNDTVDRHKGEDSYESSFVDSSEDDYDSDSSWREQPWIKRRTSGTMLEDVEEEEEEED